MLRKIISIKNVGRFVRYGATGDVELKRYNLVFAENGRGKTTLCAILRSLQCGEAAHVLGRTTLGSCEAPQITILFDDGTITFNNGAWNTTVPKLSIFDSTFVSQNVYSGDAVDLAHRRSLYRVIVGKHGVDFVEQIEKLDDESREKSAEIREKRTAVQALVPRGLTVEDFLALQEDKLIDAAQAADRKCLQFSRIGVRDTRILEWDIEEATQGAYLADRKALADYYHTCEGTLRDIVNKIRPVVETYCKNLYPGEFAVDTLGIIIGKVRTAGPTHQLFPLLDNLEALNEYTRRYHHGDNPNAATEPINETELQGFVRRTLGITGGC